MNTAVGIDHSQVAGATEVNEKFEQKAEKEFLVTQKWVFEKLKNTSGGANAKLDSTPSSRSSEDFDSTKKEPVKLPHFKGDEKCSPYLQFPIWKKRWDTLIEIYPLRVRYHLLCDHIDEYAQIRIIGVENDYVKSMEV